MKPLVLALAFVTLVSQTLGTPTDYDPGRIVKQIVERQQKLANLRARGQLTVNYLPPREHLDAIRGTYTYNFSYSTLDGRFIYDFAMDAMSAARQKARPEKAELLRRRIVGCLERVETLSLLPDGRYMGMITTDSEFPVYAVVDIMLGLRRHKERSMAQSQDWSKLILTPDDEGFEFADDTSSMLPHRWKWMNHDGTPELTRYSREDDQRVVHVLAEASEFMNFGEVRVPMRIRYRHFFHSETRQSVPIEVTVEITECVVGDEQNTPDAYNMRWPPGTIVFDQRIGFSFRTNEAKEESVSDAEIFQRAARELKDIPAGSDGGRQ